MSSTKELLRRIRGVNITRQITQTMKMASIARLGKAKVACTHLVTYQRPLEELLTTLALDERCMSAPYLHAREVKRILFIPISSHKGLCGSYNHHLLRQASGACAAAGAQGREVHLLPIGRQACKQFRHQAFPCNMEYIDLAHTATFQQAYRCAAFCIEQFVQKRYDRIVLVYQPSKQPTAQSVVQSTFLPLLPASMVVPSSSHTGYIPSKQLLMASLLPHLAALRLYQVLLQSSIAEHTARMVAMSQATDNADKLLKQLNLAYRHERQANITQEISELAASAHLSH